MTPTPEQRRSALLARRPTWTPGTLDGLLDECAAGYGERAFVVTDDRVLTYGDVADLSRRLGDGLASLGVRPGDRVGLLMANHVEFAPLKFAIARAGGIAVPFNFLYRAEELAYVLGQSRVSVLISMTGFGDLDYPAMFDAVAPGWERGPTAELPELRHVVQLPTEGIAARAGAGTVEDLLSLGDAHPGGATPAAPDDLADILYTSGTTGSPKGVTVTHDAIRRTGFASALTRAFEDGRRILFSLPCYHMFGYVEGLVAAMYVGGAIVPRLRFSAADYFAGIARHGVSEILCVPTMTVALLEHPDRHTRDLSSVFAILSGSAPGPAWLWDRVRDELGITEITTGYGMTETGGCMTHTLPEDPIERHVMTVGRPKLSGPAGLADGHLCEYRTADPLTGEQLPAGAEGELISRGPTHMPGFWEKPAETAAARRGEWVYSGDLGRVLPDGYLQITGRSKELYKSGGELVMPKEIEELVTPLPGVSQAYAVGVPDDRWGDAGCLWIVPEPGAEPDPAAILAACREKLARFKVPKHVLVIDGSELPLTPTGKVQKFKLSALAVQRLG
ncbi:class I adenylate-forming enzyme family protein [Pseudonocardia sp. RS010]|uniref:class I adenylate-forming enzyme family protein n=1 Tax=Pseudonocardia sp. RS010 TaxID=3385979 RepID=UPI0039A1D076